MPRLALFALLLCASPVLAADPTPIDKSLAVQRAVAEAKAYLTANQPADAVKSLEGVLEAINGDADFLGLLREAYGEELKRQKVSRTPDAKRVAELEERLLVLKQPQTKVAAKAEPKPPTIAEVPKPDANVLKDAAEAFNAARTQPAKFADAAKLFAAAHAGGAEFTPEQLAAWAYCRVKAAADGWNKSGRDAAATTAAVREIEAALKLAPNHADLQTAGRKLIADVGGKPSAPPAKQPTIAETGSWLALESDNFRVRFQGSSDAAKAVLTKAEEARKATFAKWSSPPSNAWQPKCDVVLHPTAAAFAAATSQPAAATGHAFVKLEATIVLDRRIDLRLDDASMADDTLARELTYIVLADLFPDRDPPRWAAIGMAVLATGTEAEQCRRTLARCYQDGELFAVGSFLEMKGPKPEQVTGYYVEAVSLVDHLVRKKDAKTFRIFLLDAQRYGVEKALDRQYGYRSAKDLDTEWRRTALTTSRAQKP
jgi:hypothetical protein